VALFVSIVLLVTPVMAQQAHVVDQAAIEAALSEHVSEDDAHREAVLRVLQREEVRSAAAKAQLDWKRAEAAVDTLEGEELAQLASIAQDVEAGLAGGNTITISTTAIIIGLLILILIIVAT
jgi:low affinity Fe/Cu permease